MQGSIYALESEVARRRNNDPAPEDLVLRAQLESVRNDVEVVLDLLEPLVGPFADRAVAAGQAGPSQAWPTAESAAATPPTLQPSVASTALQQARAGLTTVSASLEKARSALERLDEQRK
jgi:hypothetical protein